MGRISKASRRKKNRGRALVEWNRDTRNTGDTVNTNIQSTTSTELRRYSEIKLDHESTEDTAHSNLQDPSESARGQQRTPETMTISPSNILEPQHQSPLPNLNVEEEAEQELKSLVVGRRIIDLSYFFEKLKEITRHSGFGCDMQCLDLIGEKQTGFASKFTFLCRMCNKKFYIDSDDECNRHTSEINHAAVAGTIAIGAGHSQLQELSSALNLPLINASLFRKRQEIVAKKWEAAAYDAMTEAGKEEKALAIAEGRLSKDGVPLIDVIVDGCWSKRSYKKNYTALSGAAAIIGKKTKKILHLGVRNKYCSICAQAQNKNIETREHRCFKNFVGSSTSMESEILVEGFKLSLERHGVIYARIISDGDSSTHHKLLEARPYENITVEKIECKNHLLRNLCNKLQNMQTDTKYLQKDRKLLTKKRILSIRFSVVKAIKHYSQQVDANAHITLLFEDILQMHNHAFGNHTKCKPYFCNTKTEDSKISSKDEIPNEFFTSSLWQRISLIMGNFASHARSLIHNVDSNIVEVFHSVVAKMVGGKRINFSLRGGYNTRCAAAAVSFNTKKGLTNVIKSITGKSPKGSIRTFEEKKNKRLRLLKKYNYKKKRLPFTTKNVSGDKHYGDNSMKPDIPDHEIEKLKKIFLENLKKTDIERQEIEKRTILQSSSSEWLELRRSLLTASNFGRIIKKRNDTSCSNIVKDLLYKANDLCNVQSIKHGRKNEKFAIQQLEVQENVNIMPCGLFLDKDIPYLGASPDGLIGDETIVEIKCPITAHKMGIERAIKEKKVNFWVTDRNGELIINKNHVWYYQIQGQLHITKKNICLFAVWFDENQPLKTEVIYRDDVFFDQLMKPKLTAFYEECVLPEIIDPRHPRNLPIREPPCIIDAKLKKQTKSRNITMNKENKKPKKVNEPQSQDQAQPSCSKFI